MWSRWRTLVVLVILGLALGGCMDLVGPANLQPLVAPMDIGATAIDEILALLLVVEIPAETPGGVEAKVDSAIQKLEQAQGFLEQGKEDEAWEKLLGALEQLHDGLIPQVESLRCGAKKGRCIPDVEADLLIAEIEKICQELDDTLWPPPVAVATADPVVGDAPLEVALDGTASFDEDGIIVSYEWLFGDGGTASGAEVIYTYPEPGDYVAVLTVADDRGKTDTAALAISVAEPIEILFKDDFEGYGLGSLPVGTGETWCYLDYYAMPEAGWPKVETEGGVRDQFMHIYTPWSSSRQHPGTIIDIPALESGEALELSFDLRLNEEWSYFVLELVDRYFHESGAIGCVTQDPRAPVWQLEGFVFYNGYPGDPTSPYRGLLAVIMGDENPTSPGGPRKFSLCPAEVNVGTWYSYRMVHTPGLLELFMDDVKIGEVINDAYDLDEAHDWMLTFGDANSNSPGWCDVSIDNILLQIVKQ